MIESFLSGGIWEFSREGSSRFTAPMLSDRHALQLNADAAICGDGQRPFVRAAVTVVAWIPEDAADSPASS
jgi:hypothetical protein